MVDVSEAGTAEKPKELYRMWAENYFRVRALTNFLFDMAQYKVIIEGELPKEGARLLIPPRQNSLDSLSLMKAIDEYISFVFKVHERPKLIALWIMDPIGGVRATDEYVQFKKLAGHFDREGLVVAFPQGKQQPTSVTSIKPGIAELVRIYEGRYGKQVTIVPTGVEYNYPGGLPKRAPVPIFNFPFPGTTATVRFGEPKYLNGRNPRELTELVMREVAALSKLDYVAT